MSVSVFKLCLYASADTIAVPTDVSDLSSSHRYYAAKADRLCHAGSDTPLPSRSERHSMALKWNYHSHGHH